MEEWEREHIRKNLPDLTKVTMFRQSLLDKLKAEGVIVDEDVDDLTVEGLPAYKRISELYNTLKTKAKGFQALSNALLADGQTGAHLILLRGLVNHNGTLSVKLASITVFASIHPEINVLLDDVNSNILIISTPDLQLSLKRCTDVGASHMVVYNEKNVRLSKTVLQNMDAEAVLVVPCDSVEAMLRRLEGYTRNFVLFTTETEKEIKESLGQTSSMPNSFQKFANLFSKSSQTKNKKIVQEEICWTDLTPEAQHVVLQQSVKFQNQVIHLKDIPTEILPSDEIKGHVAMDLLSGMCPELVKNSIPTSPNYYIPRKIESRVRLSPEVFQNAGNDIFILEGQELYQLTNLASKGGGQAAPVSRSSEQLKVLTAQFIELEYPKDYEDICMLSKNPVHLISHSNGEYVWRKSHNSLGCLQKYILETQNHVEDEDDFVERCLKSQSPICIADSPGMGKTLLLIRIAEKVIRESSTEIVVVRFLTLRELIPDIQKQPKIDVDFVCELIARSASEYSFGKQIVSQALKSEKVKCHMFLDGYDELLSNQINTVKQFLECLRKLKATQIYMTTRLNRCHELEEALLTLGFHIKPFDEDHQVRFLVGYWNEVGAVKNDRLEQFAKSCLRRLKTNMTESERDIAGIPLQCRLLADVYTNEAKQYSEGRELVLHTEYSASTLFGMFQIFMDMSFRKVEATDKERVRRAHMYHAINLIFPEIEQEFALTLLGEDLGQLDSVLFSPGILEKSAQEESPRFIHRTLAEYLVAQFVIEFLETTQHFLERKVVYVALRKVLSTTSRKEDILVRQSPPFADVLIQSKIFEYSVICYFLNSFLSTKGVACDRHETVGSAYSMNAVSALELPNIFTATVTSNFAAVVSFIVNLKNFKTVDFPWTNLFLLAAKYAGTDLICQIITLAKFKQVQISEIKYTEFNTWMKDRFRVTPLHIAVHWGNYNIAILLLKSYGFHPLLVRENQKIQYLLHVCVMRSSEDTEQVVKDKTQIVKWLCLEGETATQSAPYRHILEERLADGSTPLLRLKVHSKIIQALIQVGANINACNYNNECVLHTVTGGLSPIQFHELIESFAENTFEHYDRGDSYSASITPLRKAIKDLDIEMRTVDIFLGKGADINNVSCGRSILFEALFRGRPKEFVQQLAKRGASLNITQVYDRTAIIPDKVMESVEYIIETTPSVLEACSWKMLNSDSQPDNLHPIINAKVDLQEMETNQLSSFVLSLHTHFNPTVTVEPYFVIHRLTSRIIHRINSISFTSGKEDNYWGLAFNYNQIKKNNVIRDVQACATKVVLLSQALVDAIEKVFAQTGKNPIVAVEEIGLMDLPKRAQQLLSDTKFAVHYESDQLGDTRNKNFPTHRIKGKLLFDLTIEHHVTLINLEYDDLRLAVPYWDRVEISDYKISSRRNISTSVFRATVDDVFVIKGLDDKKLSGFTEGILTDKSSNQISALTAKFIQLETEDDFEKICNLSNSPVHLLSYHEGNLSWVKSHGSLACVQQYIHEQQQEFSLSAFLEEFSRQGAPNFLAYDDREDVQLNSLRAAFKKQVYLNSKSVAFYINFVEKLETTVTPATIAQFIAERLSDYTLGREYIIHCLQSEEVACHLIFHYFPSIHNDMSTISKLVCYAQPFKNTYIHFAFGIAELPEVERLLQTFGFNFVRAT